MIVLIIKQFQKTGRYNWIMPDKKNLSKEIGNILRSRNLWLATAESCTGGLLGHLITGIAGSSEYYLGGFITYSNKTKENWLGVTPATLEQHGAVSRETVIEMARGIRKTFGDKPQLEKIVGISISGIAGPGGGSPEKPVGTVWIGISSKTSDEAFCFHFTGERSEIQEQSAQKALELLLNHLHQ
jgi:PncC family amidohydrolase